MFIEKLRYSEVVSFIKNNVNSELISGFSGISKYVGAMSIFATLTNGQIRCFSFNDFIMSTEMEGVDLDNLKLQWKNFMCKRFGDKYKDYSNQNLSNIHQREIVK